MGKYCRAYQLKELQAFPYWRLDPAALNADERRTDDGERDAAALVDDDVFYLQEDLRVTDGIFKDEHIVFAEESEAWAAFCRETLKFEVPVWEQTVAAGEGGV